MWLDFVHSGVPSGYTEHRGEWIHTMIFLQGCTGGKGMCNTHIQGGDSAYESESSGKAGYILAGGVYINAILIKAGNINIRNYNLLHPETLASDNMSIEKAL